jgi:hypothetical protein
MLRQHQDVFMPDLELHFFDKDFNFSRGLSWYESHFSEVSGEKAIGEKTPDYLWANGVSSEGHLSDVHKNISVCLPDVKLIIALRNPAHRAVSATKHLISTGRISPRHRIDDLLLGKEESVIERFGVMEMGKYYTQVKTYLDLFGRDQVQVIVFEEDVVSDPASGLNRVCGFLGIDTSQCFHGLRERVNAFRHSKLHLVSRYYLPKLSPLTRVLNKVLPVADYSPGKETMTVLHGHFEADTSKLFDLLRRPVPVSWIPG